MAELLVRHPPGYTFERAYILDVILGEFLGISFEAQQEPRDDVAISAGSNATHLQLRIADGLFRTRREEWLKPASLPARPLPIWKIPDELRPSVAIDDLNLPVLYGDIGSESDYYARSGNGIRLGLDIFGSAFFMLSRYEELCANERDNHDRFPASMSVAMMDGFLDRPIVNEYLEILWACLRRLFPAIERPSRTYRVLVSHDVDRLFTTRNVAWRTVVRNSLGDLLRRRDPALARRRIRGKVHSSRGNYRFEPTNTFDFIMDCSERHGVRSSFNWIAEHGTHALDADYALDMPWVQEVIRRIVERGHELGLHGSYQSYNRPGRIKAELDRLMATAAGLGARQDSWGGRQHYLRWDAGSTWQYWNDAGLSYDSTLGYPEAAGFRCGTCYEFRTFNVLERKRLKLKERPVVAMEVSLLSEAYMNMSVGDSIDRIHSLANKCRRYDGDFTLLWHNDNLVQHWQRRAYRQVMESVTA